MLWRRKRRFDQEIAPEEIFLDASQNASFNRARFEGRLEKPLSEDTFTYLGGALFILFVILAGRAWHLQVDKGSTFALQSASNSLEERILFAPRGIIVDATGVPVVENVETTIDGTPIRHYPFSSLSHVLGYVSYPKKDANGYYYETDIRGVAGIEAQYNEVLSGSNGRLLSETDAFGRVRSEGLVVQSEAGETVRLSIIAQLQEALAAAIEGVAKERRFIAGAAVVLDVHSGAVRALVSYPSFDSMVMSEGRPAATIAQYRTDPAHPFLDHAVQGVYAPGSIVKPLVAAGALTDGIITPRTVILDPGSISVPNPYRPGESYVFRGWKNLGPVDVRSAIAWSSDIFFYEVSGGFEEQRGLGIDRLAYWFSEFGLGAPTGIKLPGEAEGLIPTPQWKERVFGEPWYLGDTYFTAIGQYSVQVTPVQMARAIAAIANGGTLYEPTLLADEESVVQGKVPASADALAVVREGMRETVTEALATALSVPYVSVAAKTGTAQTGTRNQYDNSWVVGFFPYEEPEYAFALVLERGPEGTGGQAVQAMRRALDTLFADQSPILVDLQ